MDEMSNVVTLLGLVEVPPHCTPQTVEAMARRFGTVWMVRFIPVLRGALVAFATHEEVRQQT